MKSSWLKEQLEKQNTQNNFEQLIYQHLSTRTSELGLYLSVRNKNRLDVGDFNQHDFYLAFELDVSGLIVPYFVFRTSSWAYDGERTDLHDCQSLMFGLCNLTKGYSVSLWDIGNPFTEIEEELYGRYATIVQPNLSVVTQDSVGLTVVDKIIEIYQDYLSFYLPYRCQSNKLPLPLYDSGKLNELRDQISIEANVDTDEVWVNQRANPHWVYVQIYSKKISIIKSPLCINMLKKYLCESEKSHLELQDERVCYLKSNDLKHCFNIDDLDEMSTLLSSLSNADVQKFAIDSHVYMVSGDWLAVKKGDFGFERFLDERKLFLSTMKNKIAYLYDDPDLVWDERGSPERFEELCLELLSREPHVTRARKVSPTNQPDRGRDIVAELVKYKPKDELVYEGEQVLQISKYLVQCKLTSKTLGIPKGMGPFEALYLGDYSGYLLITNSTLSSDHTALLEKLRSDPKFEADWWTKVEIEERLKSNMDLMYKYSDLVKIVT